MALTRKRNFFNLFFAKLKKLYRIVSKSTLGTIYKQGILPSVLYRILLWGSCKDTSDVNNIHIRAARFIMKVKKSVSNELVLKQDYTTITSRTTQNHNHFKLDVPRFNQALYKRSQSSR